MPFTKPFEKLSYEQEIDPDVCPMPEPLRTKLNIIIPLMWLFFISFVSRVIFAPLMPAIENDLNFSHAQAGRLFFIVSIGSLLAPLISGFISSRIFHRRSLAFAASLSAIILLLFQFSNDLWSIRILMIFVGIAAGLHLPSAVPVIGAEVQKKDIGKAMSIHQLAPPMGFISAPFITALFINWISWRYILMLWGIVLLLSAIIFYFKGKGGNFPGKILNPENVKAVFKIPAFWIIILLLASAMGGSIGIYTILPLFLVNQRGIDLSTANIIIGFAQITGLIVIFLSGWLVDKFGQKPVMAMSLITAGIATILLGTLTDIGLIIIIFIQPILINAFFPGCFAALASAAPPSLRSVATAMGPPLAFVIGGGFIPAMIGYLGEAYSFSTGIIIAGIFMLVVVFFILYLKFKNYADDPGC
ncbi:MAG: MFS transporter [Spirochaetes bacterium]|nr:MFS transporter [Spirochaetota bacterium]